MDHLSEETLKRFVAGTASREENRVVVAHLLKGCVPCAQKLRELMEPEPVSRRAYEPALDHFDRGLIETLESSISPVQTLRTMLRGVLLDPPEGPKKKR
jgi:hypothetical protein